MRVVTKLLHDWKNLDRRATIICIWAPIALTLSEYFFVPANAFRHLTAFLLTLGGSRAILALYAWWTSGNFVLQILIPSTLLWMFTRTSPRALGLRVRGTGHDAVAYLALYLVFLPVVYIFSRRPEFRLQYPFFHPPNGPASPEFLLFEAIYCLQFLCVEFFFRGVLVLGLKPTLGRVSVLIALAPYCMIHYHKPLPEALGAIGAGLVLGALAWETETVLYGWGLHYAVALSMDLLALR